MSAFDETQIINLFLSKFIVPNFYRKEHFKEMENWSDNKLQRFKEYMTDELCYDDSKLRDIVESCITKFEEQECVYVIKTYNMDGTYAGLFETGSPEYKKKFDSEEEARGWFDALIKEGGQDTYSAVELIEIDPTSEDRETIIDDWEEQLEEEEES